MNRPAAAPSDALLERYVLGDLDPARAEGLRLLAESDAGVRARIEAIRASDADILAAYPAESMAPAIRARRSASKEPEATKARATAAPAGRPAPFPAPLFKELFSPKGLRFARPAFAILAFGVFILARQDWNGSSETPDPLGNIQVALADQGGDVRLKGAESGLAIFRKTGAGSELLPPRSAARPGDTLQVFYHSRKALYGIVFSVDGKGSVTLHYPEADGPAPALQIGDMLPLPHAFRLDNAPRFERFYLVTSPRPFASESLLVRLRGNLPAGASPADSLAGLEADFRQYPYTINKPERGASPSRKESGK